MHLRIRQFTAGLNLTNSTTLHNTTRHNTALHRASLRSTTPPHRTAVAGTYVEVAWGPLYNHGGGYSYRLCPLDNGGGITEECFQRTPLQFDINKQTLVWNTKAVRDA
jgi:hypothetical protein